MNIQTLLQTAVERNIITPEQRAQLDALARTQQTGTSAMSTVLFLGGGALGVLAMTLLMAASFDSVGWGGMLLMAVVYGVGFVLTANWLRAKPGLALAASVVAMLPVVVAPFGVYALQEMLDLWAYGRPYASPDMRVLAIELTAFATAVALWRWLREPLQLLPVIASGWFILIELTGANLWNGDNTLQVVTGLYGAALLGLALWLDVTNRAKDMAWWPYLGAAVSLLIGLFALWDHDAGGRLLFALGSAVLVLVGGLLARRVLALAGAVGLCGYVVYTVTLVVNSLMGAAIVLVTLAAAIIWLGMQWVRHEQAIMARLRRILPEQVQALIEARLSNSR
jgi:hypothetical protein